MSHNTYPPDLRAAAVADYASGLSMGAVAKKHGIADETVRRWVPRDMVRVVRRSVDFCTVDGCSERHKARGYCQRHYGRIFLGRKPRHNTSNVNIEDRIEDCRWMASTGEGLTGAAGRIGIAPNALEAWLRRRDKATLAVLIAQDPLPVGGSQALFHGAGIRVLR